MPYELPFVPSLGFYRFDTTLFGVVYVFDVSWNAVDGAWYMDILTDAQVVVASGIKLALGAAIGARLRDPAAPPGFFFVVDTSGKGVDATFDDMGTRVRVRFFHVTELALFLSLGRPVV